MGSLSFAHPYFPEVQIFVTLIAFFSETGLRKVLSLKKTSPFSSLAAQSFSHGVWVFSREAF